MPLFSRKTKKQKAFSFVEVMISLFVLSVGFLGVIQLATTTLRNSFFQRDAVIASMLAQEGVELVYNVRDTNLAKGNPAFQDINVGVYRVSPLDSMVSLQGGTDYVLKKDGNNFYVHSAAGTQTKFSRKIVVEGSGADRTITSIVIWGGGSFPSGPVNTTTCNKSNRCYFVRSVLQE